MTGHSYTANDELGPRYVIFVLFLIVSHCHRATSPPPACLTTHQPVAPTPILLRHTQIHRHNTKAPPRRHAVVTCKTHHDSTPNASHVTTAAVSLPRHTSARGPGLHTNPAQVLHHPTVRSPDPTLCCCDTQDPLRQHPQHDFTCTNMACKSLPTTPRQHRLRDDYGYKDEDDGCNEKNDGSKGNGNGTSVTPAPRQQH
ncbi:hypothetical protein EDB84DRAFT_1441599 [Lactarius hengduanensis]|nr:hypothetical protein EDB84DRAFT_1443104 [Lactarius hengduanensis]KAH9021081.1 hypothetical protein EDB84DRAFT_1441599 [Lactarius hengduanensis]